MTAGSVINDARFLIMRVQVLDPSDLLHEVEIIEVPTLPEAKAGQRRRRVGNMASRSERILD